MARRSNLSRLVRTNRPGLPRSLNDIGYFYDAANFAAFIVADRIEVIRESLTAGGSRGGTMATQERPASL